MYDPVDYSNRNIDWPRRTVLRVLAGTAASFCIAAVPAFSSWEVSSGTDQIALKFQDASGRPHNMNYFAGAPLLVNFWASWCAPCLIELPALDRLAHDPSRGALKIVALSLDANGMAPVQDVFRRAKIRNLEPLVDLAQESVEKVGVPSLPFTMLLAADARILATRQGRVDWDSRSERQTLRALALRFRLG